MSTLEMRGMFDVDAFLWFLYPFVGGRLLRDLKHGCV